MPHVWGMSNTYMVYTRVHFWTQPDACFDESPLLPWTRCAAVSHELWNPQHLTLLETCPALPPQDWRWDFEFWSQRPEVKFSLGSLRVAQSQKIASWTSVGDLEINRELQRHMSLIVTMFMVWAPRGAQRFPHFFTFLPSPLTLGVGWVW